MFVQQFLALLHNFVVLRTDAAGALPLSVMLRKVQSLFLSVMFLDK